MEAHSGLDICSDGNAVASCVSVSSFSSSILFDVIGTQIIVLSW